MTFVNPNRVRVSRSIHQNHEWPAIAYARSADCFVFVSLCTVPKGWSKSPVFDGWVQIVRGPRPKSETWPRAKKHGNAVPPGKPKSHSPQVPPVRQPSHLPEQVAPDAAEEVHRLEAAVQVLGGEKSRVLLVAGISSNEEASDEGRRFDCQGCGVEDEVAEGEERLKQLEARSVEGNGGIRARCDGVAAENRGVGPRTRRITCPHAGSVVCRRPPLPPVHGRHQCQVPISKSCEGDCELRNALEFGDTTTIAKLGELVGQGTSAMASIAVTVSSDGASKSILMSAVIDQVEAKRCCLCSWIRCTVPISGGQSCF